MNSVDHKPITIVGAGLAGLALGIGLRQQRVPVMLYEAGALPRHRVCGEFICGRGTNVLKELGVANHLDEAVYHQKVEWYHKGKPLFRHSLPTPATGISRYLLDQRLAETFCALGGQLQCQQRFRVESEGLTNSGMVLCNGRQRAAGPPRWLGLKVHLKTARAATAGLKVYLGDGGYVGLSGIEQGKVNLCGLFRIRPSIGGGKIERLCAYLRAAGLNTLSELIQSSEVDADSFCAVTALDFSMPKQSHHQLRLGDQFGMIAPFTGNGMSIALESAQIALEPLLAYAQGDCDWAEAIKIVQTKLSRRFKTRIRIARCLQPLLLCRSGQLSLGRLGQLQLLPINPLYQLTH